MSELSVAESIKFYAKLLKLPTFSNVEEPVRHFHSGQSLESFLLSLMKREYDARQVNQLKHRLHYAGFPLLKTLEEFDLSRLEHVTPKFVKQLASCEFIRHHENVIMVGTPGTGKTHLMTAMGVKACQCGFKVVFRNASTLVTELREARDEYSLRRMGKKLSTADLLLIDELSYAKFNSEESELLFKVIGDRAERTSTMITTNLSFSHWTEMFSNDTLTAALVDRLTFHSHVLDMNGTSYRLNHTLQTDAAKMA